MYREVPSSAGRLMMVIKSRPSRASPLTKCGLGSKGSQRPQSIEKGGMSRKGLRGEEQSVWLTDLDHPQQYIKVKKKPLKIKPTCHRATKITSRNDYPHKTAPLHGWRSNLWLHFLRLMQKSAVSFWNQSQGKKTCGNYRERCFRRRSQYICTEFLISQLNVWRRILYPKLISLLSHSTSLEVFSWLVLRFSRGKVVFQEALKILEGRPLLRLLAPAGQHELVQWLRALGWTGHPVPTLHLVQNFPVYHTWPERNDVYSQNGI